MFRLTNWSLIEVEDETLLKLLRESCIVMSLSILKIAIFHSDSLLDHMFFPSNDKVSKKGQLKPACDEFFSGLKLLSLNF